MNKVLHIFNFENNSRVCHQLEHYPSDGDHCVLVNVEQMKEIKLVLDIVSRDKKVHWYSLKPSSLPSDAVKAISIDEFLSLSVEQNPISSWYY